jgi:hypothetical protein
VIVKWYVNLLAAVHIHHYKQAPARPKELSDARQVIYSEKDGHIARRAQGVLAACEAFPRMGLTSQRSYNKTIGA